MRTNIIASASRKAKFTKLQRDQAEFYGAPIDRAILYLADKDHLTFEQIADVLYKGEVSRQAIQFRYKKLNGGDKRD